MSKIRDQKALHDVKKILGIPQYEPIFIMRGQDVAVASTIDHYGNVASARGATEHFVENIRESEREFVSFAEEHSDKMKVPDMPAPVEEESEADEQ